MAPLGLWLNILQWAELASELLGTFKWDIGDIIENAIVCLEDREH